MPKKKILSSIEKASQWLTESIGTNTSILIHTIFFIGIFGLSFLGVSLEKILLILTTAVSLEAIYLAIFIQMSVNRASQTITEVGEEIEDIQENVEDIQEDVEDIQEDVEDLQENVEDIQEDVEDIQEDTESDDEVTTTKILNNIEVQLNLLKDEIAQLKKKVN